MRQSIIYMAAFCVVAVLAAAEEKQDLENIGIDQQIKIIEAATPGLVIVEYDLRYDKGQPPSGADVSYMCPNCGRPHTRRVGEQLIKDERPLEEAGFLVSQTTVMTRDTAIPSRFIKEIRVRFGNKTVSANISAYATDNNAVFLKLDRQLDKAVPMKFGASDNDADLLVIYGQKDDLWTISLQPLPTYISISDQSRKFIAVPPSCLIVDKNGVPKGISMNQELSLDDSWKGSPNQWAKLSAQELEEKLRNAEKLAANSLLRVSLNFRSPKAKAGQPAYFRSYNRGVNTQTTEENGIGVCIDKKNILVLVSLAAETTARLEKIRVFDADGKTYDAKFVGTLSDFGALIVSLDKPLENPVVLADTDIAKIKHKLLLKAKVSMAGEERITNFSHGRVIGCKTGHSRRIYPVFNGTENDVFFFNMENGLVALPLSVRQKLSLRNNNQWRQIVPLITSVSEISPVISDPTAHLDSKNIPLSEKKEDRVGWMGVVLQQLTPDLARANHCSEQTRDGQTGALISFVYPDSPAAQAGIIPGMVLLRLSVEKEPKPIEVKAEANNSSYAQLNSVQLNSLPLEYFERMPPPWPSVKNNFSRILTEIGKGTKYTAELIHEGKEISKGLTVRESPSYYDSAAKHKSKKAGMTIRDLTFEVRSHFKKKQNDPGIVVSKVETGSKAAVAGIRPYELITHVNGNPITSIDQIVKIIEKNEEMDLSVERMNHARQVRIKFD
ncbi:PDZ domain-containing protein [Verrucomicrobiota bacterium]